MRGPRVGPASPRLKGWSKRSACWRAAWKFLILFQLFGGKVTRFSDLERAIPAVTQKMLAQQLRQLEKDGIVHRQIYPEIPPEMEYSLTPWGQSLCPVLDVILKWASSSDRPTTGEGAPLS